MTNLSGLPYTSLRRARELATRSRRNQLSQAVAHLDAAQRRTGQIVERIAAAEARQRAERMARR